MPRLAPVALALIVLAGCGGGGGDDGGNDRLTLTTPKGAPKATATPKPAGKVRTGPVTAAEKRVIRGWSDALRRGRVDRAVRYWEVPAIAANGGQPRKLLTREAVRVFNQALPCGARFESAERDERWVLATFRLTERKGGAIKCGSGVGNRVRTAFLIRGDKIAQWLRASDPPEASDTPGGTTS